MRAKKTWMAALAVVLLPLSGLACQPADGGPDAVEVSPGHEDTTPQDATRPGPDVNGPAGSGSAIWVLDAGDVPVGVLVRRGSDDSTTGDQVLDTVQVFNPSSGLFFDITMSDGVVRPPGILYFSDGNCSQPVGLANTTGCGDCVSGYAQGVLAGGGWWRIRGGRKTVQKATVGSIRPSTGLDCTVHGAANTPVFEVERVTGVTPPTHFTPPLHFAWR